MSSKSPGQKRKLIVVSVLMLDDTEVPFQLDAKTTGQEFINMVYEYLKLVESDYFSLEFYNPKDQKVSQYTFDLPKLKNEFNLIK